MPGSTPATSQLDWLSSTTAMIVLSWSKAARDLLKSFSWGIRALRQLFASDDGAISSPHAPYHLSPVEEARFEPSVPRKAPDTDAFKRRCSAPVCGCRACSLGASNDSRRLSAVPTVGDSGNERLSLSRPGGICAVEPAMLCDFCETEMEHCRPCARH